MNNPHITVYTEKVHADGHDLNENINVQTWTYPENKLISSLHVRANDRVLLEDKLR